MSVSFLSSIASRRVLLLSPHADDVAYSIGGLVAQLTQRARLARSAQRSTHPGLIDHTGQAEGPRPAGLRGDGSHAGNADLRLLTVFGRSGWALPRSLRRAGADAVSTQRRQEDQAYCDRHGIAFDLLPVPDSALSGYDEVRELTAAPEDDARAPDAATLIGAVIARTAPQVVLAPCALGGHVDHRIVRDAACALEDSTAGFDLLFYEDVPYSATLGLADIERRLIADGLMPAATVSIDAVLDAKVDDMWAYRSQTSAPTVAQMLLHAGRVAGDTGGYAERLWRRATPAPEAARTP